MGNILAGKEDVVLRRLGPLTIFVLVVAQALVTGAGSPAVSATSSSLAAQAPSAPLVDPPGTRCCQGIASDQTNLVMFGGCCETPMVPYGDTWLWNGTGWNPAPPGPGPCPRRSTRAVWDGFHVMLFGGNGGMGGGGCPGGNYRDTWVWDVSTSSWLQVCAMCGPTARFAVGMAYDPTRGYVVLFGGNSASPFVGGPTVFDENGSVIVPNGETWLWRGSTDPMSGSWVQKSQANPPCPRTSPGLAWDAVKGKVLMFGGNGGDGGSGCLPGSYNDTWTWEGTKWKLCTACTTLPDPRFGHRMEWDLDNVLSEGPQAVMYGGTKTLGGPTDETWVIDGGAWQLCTTCTPPSARCCPGLAYFSTGNLILYGGQDMGGIGGTHRELSGTWRFDGNVWTCITICDP